MLCLHVDVSPVLQEVSDAQRGVRGALRGQDHVDGPSTPLISADDPPRPGVQQELDGSQLAVEAGHVEG